MWTNAGEPWQLTLDEFQSLSRDSVHVDSRRGCCAVCPSYCFNPSVGIPSMWTEGAQLGVSFVRWFQSLSRDSVHVDHRVGKLLGVIQIEFQSLSRDSVHVDGTMP